MLGLLVHVPGGADRATETAFVPSGEISRVERAAREAAEARPRARAPQAPQRHPAARLAAASVSNGHDRVPSALAAASRLQGEESGSRGDGAKLDE
eukprot:2697685-Pyramimonas_sp.AAC.4